MFNYTKETLIAEFKVAKEKDIKLGGGDENAIHNNRIQFMKDHIELRKTNPEYYDGLDINFSNLLAAYQSADPRDTFYKTIFGKSYEEVTSDSKPVKMSDYA